MGLDGRGRSHGARAAVAPVQHGDEDEHVQGHNVKEHKRPRTLGEKGVVLVRGQVVPSVGAQCERAPQTLWWKKKAGKTIRRALPPPTLEARNMRVVFRVIFSAVLSSAYLRCRSADANAAKGFVVCSYSDRYRPSSSPAP